MYNTDLNNKNTTGISTTTGVPTTYEDGPYIYPSITYPTYPNYFPQYQQIVVYPQPYFVQQMDNGTQARLDDIEARLAEVSATLKSLMDLLSNEQDEEVCGHSEGECNSVDSEGSSGKVLALRAPEPRGSTTWPPRS